MKIYSIVKISQNPFWISESLPYFFDGYDGTKINYNIMFLILPFLLTKSIRDNILINATSKSSFDSLFFNPGRKDRKDEKKFFKEFDDSLINKTALIGIEEKYHLNKNIMHKTLLIAYQKGYVDFKNGFVIPIKRYDYKDQKSENFLFDYYKCNRNLGIIFSKETVENLYRKSQIKKI